MKIYISIIFCLVSFCAAYGQVGGRVADSRTGQPLAGATIVAREHSRWAVADVRGTFRIDGLPRGEVRLSVSHLGYVGRDVTVAVSAKATHDMEILLDESTLEVAEVVVHARRKSDDATTVYTIDRAAIDHLQAVSVTDIAALLPGGRTDGTGAPLISARRFALRTGSGAENGNPTFGTAVEVDGVRLSNNASMDGMTSAVYGADVRNVGASGIETVEIITGIPSVEHGDLSGGVVKISTRKGRSPLIAEFITKPNVKQYSLDKGLSVGGGSGALNINAERAESVSDIASPYTSYKRNTLSIKYSDVFSARSPLRFDAGVTGGVGGYDSSSDPDYYRDTYSRARDNTLRGNVGVKWLLERRWITDIEASVSANYVDRRTSAKEFKSSASATATIHGEEEGYHSAEGADVVMIPAGEWYQASHDDSRLFTLTAKVKALWSRRLFGDALTSRLMAGAEFSSEGNLGRGVWYDDASLAPTWRERRYSDLPWARNLAVYGEETASMQIWRGVLQATAGLRAERTTVGGSVYGAVQSLSPRFNLKYSVGAVTLRAGWGRAVKLPSFSVLYPSPSYTDIAVFSGYEGDRLYRAFYSYPLSAAANPDLRWQRNTMREAGVDVRLKGVNFSLSFFSNTTFDPYAATSVYTPFTHRFTDQRGLDALAIPVADRLFSIDRTTGTVTVSDKSGALADQTLEYKEMLAWKGASSRTNASPVVRRGVEWVVDFSRIRALQMSVRIDGKYYYYKSVDCTLYPATFQSAAADGSAYPYIAYYVGTTGGTSNGSTSSEIDANLTVTTHITAARLIFSLRVETCLLKTSRNLSEYGGGQLGFVIDSRQDSHPSATQDNIYGGDRFVAVYPLYYTTHDDPDTLIPFAGKFEWARENDPVLYDQLVHMVNRTNYDYTYNRQSVYPYFSANIAVTKEIGRLASITFTANNFFNNTGRVRESWTDTTQSLYGQSRIPSFYYGLSLRIKI